MQQAYKALNIICNPPRKKNVGEIDFWRFFCENHLLVVYLDLRRVLSPFLLVLLPWGHHTLVLSTTRCSK